MSPATRQRARKGAAIPDTLQVGEDFPKGEICRGSVGRMVARGRLTLTPSTSVTDLTRSIAPPTRFQIRSSTFLDATGRHFLSFKPCVTCVQIRLTHGGQKASFKSSYDIAPYCPHLPGQHPKAATMHEQIRPAPVVERFVFNVSLNLEKDAEVGQVSVQAIVGDSIVDVS